VLATAVLALLDAAAGDVRSAEDRLAWVTARLDARPGHPATARFARAATALCTAQLGESATGEPGEPAEWSSASLRCVDRVIQAATRGRAPFFVSLDRPIARHPLAQRALVALGVLEVVDAGGHPVPVGGHAERALAAARAQLAGTEIPGAPAGDRLDGPDLRHPRTAVEAATLGAVFAERRGDHAEAERLTREAIGVSDATGIRAPILDHGRHLLGVLERIVDDPDAPGPVGREILAKLQHRAADRMVQPLTDREVDVLQLLPSLMSNAEIARDLGVSVNTVKTHLKSVYRKLDVDCRREAVQRGRVLDLL
jgi:DNA-binding CsgD family transcriptional regulator